VLTSNFKLLIMADILLTLRCNSWNSWGGEGERRKTGKEAHLCEGTRLATTTIRITLHNSKQKFFV
jgi:hypothetical protein